MRRRLLKQIYNQLKINNFYGDLKIDAPKCAPKIKAVYTIRQWKCEFKDKGVA